MRDAPRNNILLILFYGFSKEMRATIVFVCVRNPPVGIAVCERLDVSPWVYPSVISVEIFLGNRAFHQNWKHFKCLLKCIQKHSCNFRLVHQITFMILFILFVFPGSY